MKYYLIAGEASGDLHASKLMNALKKEDPQAQFRFFGGDLMQAEGGTLVKHYSEMAYMGFIPVLLNIDKVLILVDYPGFNLRMAKFAKTRLNIPVHYYISPKIWAWKEYRIKDIKRYVDKMYSILPFEIPFYQKHLYQIDYVGNPTVDEMAVRPFADEKFDSFISENNLENKPIIALLAGSRKAEITANLPTMIDAASSFTDYQLVIAGAPGISPDFYHTFISGKRVSIVFEKTYRLLQQSSAALVTSGTATLETAILKIPQVVCYKMGGGKIAYNLFKHILKVKFVSLVNLIADREIVKELLVHLFTTENVKNELDKILNDPDKRKQMLQGYAEVAERLGNPGAPQNAAKKIVATIKSL